MQLNHILSLIKRCHSVTTFKQIHSHILTVSVHHDNHLLSRLIDLKDLSYATLFFSQIPRPNPYSYNIMIRALVTTWSDHVLALEFFLRMLRSGRKPDNFTYPFILAAFANLHWLSGGKTTHSSTLKSGLHLDSHTQHSLITMYCRCAVPDDASRVFDEIPEKDSVSWNSMISGYAKMGLGREAVSLFDRMGREGFEVDERTLVSVLTACRDLGDLSLGKSMEEIVEAKGIALSSYVGPALIDMYGKCGDLQSARRVFEALPEKNKIAWNAMITGYSQNGQSNESIVLFQEMRCSGVEPDKITMVGVLSACASIGAFDIGRWIDLWASQKGMLLDVYIGTGLIDMHAKCGNLERAIEIFQGMPWKNEVTWNAMVSAFAFHGRAQEALTLFTEMKDEENVQPDEITFLGVLSACIHAGLVVEGRKLFNAMENEYGITPEIEHYSCMVDLLARAGLVEEAWAFVEKIPGQPDAIMLGALLSACNNCRNAVIGERVLQCLLEIEPLNSGNYVISSKMYAGSKRLDDSARMRGLMRDRGVSKVPGCSWIQILSQLHEFRSGDGLHLTSVEIHQLLDSLNKELMLSLESCETTLYHHALIGAYIRLCQRHLNSILPEALLDGLQSVLLKSLRHTLVNINSTSCGCNSSSLNFSVLLDMALMECEDGKNEDIMSDACCMPKKPSMA